MTDHIPTGTAGGRTQERRTIAVTAYRDPDGYPTCCLDTGVARCRFMGARKMGSVEVCMVTGDDIVRGPFCTDRGDLAPRSDARWLRPVDGCPVWHPVV